MIAFWIYGSMLLGNKEIGAECTKKSLTLFAFSKVYDAAVEFWNGDAIPNLANLERRLASKSYCMQRRGIP